MVRLIPAFILTLLILSCGQSSDNKQQALARVGNRYLLKSDLAGIIPTDVSSKDSAALVQSYIQSWIMDQLLLDKAEKNLAEERKDFERQLNEYRKSLLIYAYENQLLAQSLDTVVSDNEIATYYNANLTSFTLPENICRVRYILTDKNSPDLPKIKKALGASDDKSADLRSAFCSNKAYKCNLNDSLWLTSREISAETSLKPADQDKLMNRGFFETSDSASVCLYYVLEYKIKESVSPLVLEKDKIRALIIRSRKLEFLKKMHGDIYEEAKKNEDFEIYK
jgi:hypothetical protein